MIIPGIPQKPTTVDVNKLIGMCKPKWLLIKLRRNNTNAPIASFVIIVGNHFKDLILNNPNNKRQTSITVRTSFILIHSSSTNICI